MKKIFSIIVLIFLSGCISEGGSDCFKKSGEIITKEIQKPPFEKINISRGISLIVKESEEQSIVLKAGKNFAENIAFDVTEGELMIRDNTKCGLLNAYHEAEVHVSTPMLKKIYSSSQYYIRSDGVLTFPELQLESGIAEDTAASVFELEIDNEKLQIQDNVASVFKIKGKTDFLEVKFWGMSGRLESAELAANEINVHHRSTNDMIVYPVEKISGKIMSTGNLVLKNLPPVVDVEEVYTGKVIYP